MISQEKEKKSLKYSCNNLYKVKLVLPNNTPGCPENGSLQTKIRKEKENKNQNETTKADTV